MKRASPPLRWSLRCVTCGKEVVPVQGVTAIRERGYWWHAHCVKIAYWREGEPAVDFPSGGMLVPDTICGAGDYPPVRW